jgi:hypothetical protein
MVTLTTVLFVLALAVSVGAYGASVWTSIKRPQMRKPNSDSSSQTLS